MSPRLFDAIWTLIVLAFGIFAGWCARSIQFIRDKDCANPDHSAKDSSSGEAES